ncbi:Os01g0274601 [Oryza sativa Japonica Group]|uniref:Os01g0274601 protein n=1 Tax=Oryza sativa subsp. japonica TaxID=39947 RepID=A0A0P0V0W2_ORYSJ|nr:Os01g0274601 [Oryza sativa Japonica Group]
MKGSNPHPSVSSPPSHTHTRKDGLLICLFGLLLLLPRRRNCCKQQGRPLCGSRDMGEDDTPASCPSMRPSGRQLTSLYGAKTAYLQTKNNL